ncbi:MAG: Peptidase S8/S53 subtilisin kexin sedolisin [Ignavibacteria bacterium]|nr:MAG: Peptidase S8/S53 subtilisin kexin sedolisin [Ignavibacteria bacterium]KAF0161342.1 MAG: Peptidase S8/S53 subtilisin kexin sedolisin [Ignavibacteria bacterium]
MKKFLLILFFLNISKTIIAQTNWLIFKAAPIPSNSLENHFPFKIQKGNKENISINDTQIYSFLKEEYLRKVNTIPENFIVCMLQDKKGSIWFGTFGGGLAKFDGIKWKVFNTFNSLLPSDVVYSLAVDNNNNIWIGTVDGLAKFDGINWEVFNETNSKIPSNMIYSLAIDKQDNKWIGTTKGLARLSRTNWKIFDKRNSKIPHNHVTSLAVDNENRLWAGTFGGLAKFDGVSWSLFKESNSPLPYNDIYSLSVDKANKIYIGTWGGGFATLHKSKWKIFRKSNSKLPDNFVSSIIIDDRKRVFVGTLSGMAKVNGSKWSIFKNSNSPLPSNFIYSLLKDNFGNTWVGTENGLAVYNDSGFRFEIKKFETVKEELSKVAHHQQILIGYTKPSNNNTIENIFYNRKGNKIFATFTIQKREYFSVVLENPLTNESVAIKNEILEIGKHLLEFSLENAEENFYLLRITIGDYICIKKIHFVDFD